MKKRTESQQGFTHDTRIELSELAGELERASAALAEQMKSAPHRMRVEAAYGIPYREQDKVDAQPILVTPLDGQAAIEAVIEGLTAIHLKSEKQSARETLRVPGVVGLPSDWISQLVVLNGVKGQIEQLVTSRVKLAADRTKLWKSLIPRHSRFSSLQVIRQVRVLETAPRQIAFYWDASPSVERRTAAAQIAEYEELLKEAFDYVPTQLEDGSKYLKYLYGIQTLRGLPGDEFVATLRHGKPHPRARITFLDTTPRIIRPAPTPIVYDISDPRPRVVALHNWEPTNLSLKVVAEKTDRQKIDPEPLEESLYLHRYLPAHRFEAKK